jgi:hypothetical protein
VPHALSNVACDVAVLNDHICDRCTVKFVPAVTLMMFPTIAAVKA